MTNIDVDTDILTRVSEAVANTSAPRDLPKRPASRKTRKWTLPGICSGTRVSTSFGEVPAQLIRVRDRLRTRDGRFLPVLRIDEYKLDDEFMAQHPEARPIRFTAKVAGQRNDAIVHVSPGQQVLARDAAGTETMRLAGDFLDRPGVMPDAHGALTYYVFHLGETALVRAEGMWIALGE